MRLNDYDYLHGNLAVYQQLGLLKLLPPKTAKLRFVKPQPKDYHVDEQGVTHLDTWIAPVAGKMQMVTLA
jgi:hypothetical protein